MIIEAWAKHRSWFYSAGIAILITAWLLSGALGGTDSEIAVSDTAGTMAPAPRSKVRVRTQSAEEVVRTIIVNGETAPARVVQISAETDGRVTSIGA